jgi:hypothetical protein
MYSIVQGFLKHSHDLSWTHDDKTKILSGFEEMNFLYLNIFLSQEGRKKG